MQRPFAGRAADVPQAGCEVGQRFYPYNIHWNCGMLPQAWEDPRTAPRLPAACMVSSVCSPGLAGQHQRVAQLPKFWVVTQATGIPLMWWRLASGSWRRAACT